MFDFDNVKASVQEKACRIHRVRQVLNDLRNVNINDIVSNDIDRIQVVSPPSLFAPKSI